MNKTVILLRGAFLLFFALNLAWLGRPLPAQASVELQAAFNKVADMAKPAVVNIQVIQEHRARVYEPEFFFGIPDFRERIYRWETQGAGSGVIIDPDGYVLTNAHVVRGANEIRITRIGPGGKEIAYSGEVTGSDPRLDIAVVRIKSSRKLPYLKLADSAKIKVGDWVLAVGYPFGFKQTVTAGIVSSLDQSLVIEGRRYPNLIQTDAAINQGNSGGPLLNLNGEVIGINAAIFSPSGAFAGIGFAIPVKDMKWILDGLISGKEVKRGWIGVLLAPMNNLIVKRLGLPVSEGALINSVIEGSPAARAGIKRGDIIVSCDGKRISSSGELVSIVFLKKPGTTIKLELYRKGVEKEVFVKLAERPDERTLQNLRELPASSEMEAKIPGWEGIEVSISNARAEIISINWDSKLHGYLKTGDILNGINRKEIKSEETFEKATAGADLSDGVVFDITRNGQPMYISVQVK